MESISITKLHKLQLEIAKEIKRVCITNGIDYFLVGGTLLGAVRHGGFIPWDDDMDIGMTNLNYEKFIKIAPKCLDGRFSLHCYENDMHCGYMFAKVRLKYSHMREVILESSTADDGIFVDIFPYDQVSERDSKRSCFHMLKMRLLSKFLMVKSGYKLNSITHSLKGKLINSIVKLIPISRGAVWKNLVKENLRCSDNSNKDYFVERDGMFRGNFVFPVNKITPTTQIEFEQIFFNAPADYHYYLKQAYGDYMQFPPIDKRYAGHSVIDIVLDKPYDWYFQQFNRSINN